jgi:hypothetical protein
MVPVLEPHQNQRAQDLRRRPQMQADTLLADKAFDADKRLIEPLLQAGKTAVIPSIPGRKQPRPYDREARGRSARISNDTHQAGDRAR